MPNTPALAELTDRQIEVLGYVAKRLTIKEIAQRMAISPGAVNDHIRKLKDRLGVNSLSELAGIHRGLGEVGAGRGGIPAFAEGTFARSGGGSPDHAGLDRDYTKDPPVFSPLSGNLDLRKLDPSDAPGQFSLADSMAFPAGEFWLGRNEPRVVPGLLDGKHGGMPRMVVILGLTMAILITIILGVTAFDALSNVADNLPATPVERTS